MQCSYDCMCIRTWWQRSVRSHQLSPLQGDGVVAVVPAAVVVGGIGVRGRGRRDRRHGGLVFAVLALVVIGGRGVAGRPDGLVWSRGPSARPGRADGGPETPDHTAPHSAERGHHTAPHTAPHSAERGHHTVPHSAERGHHTAPHSAERGHHTSPHGTVLS